MTYFDYINHRFIHGSIKHIRLVDVYILQPRRNSLPQYPTTQKDHGQNDTTLYETFIIMTPIILLLWGGLLVDIYVNATN